MGRLPAGTLQNKAALHQRIASGSEDALECLEQVLTLYGEEAWKIKLKSSVYTVVDAITSCRDAAVRHQLLDRLEAAYPAGHELWKDTVMLSIKADWAMVERYRKNHPQAAHQKGLVRQTVLSSTVVRGEHIDQAFDVFSRLVMELPEKRRAVEVADAWQYAVIGMNVSFMEKILGAFPIDLNQPMLGEPAPKEEPSLSSPRGMDVVFAICQCWKSYGTDDSRFQRAFLLLERHGLDWSRPADRWEKVPQEYQERIRTWHHQAKQEHLEAVLADPPVNDRRPRSGPRM